MGDAYNGGRNGGRCFIFPLFSLSFLKKHPAAGGDVML